MAASLVRHIVAVEPMPRHFGVRPPLELNLIRHVLIALASSHDTSQRLVSAVCSLSDFGLARSRSLSVGAWLPSAAPDSARALDWAAADPRRILPEPWTGRLPISVWRIRLAPAAEPWGQRRRRRAGNTAVRGCLYPLARGCRAPRRMTPELAATAPAIPVWRYRLVAGAAELGGSVADRGACNNAVRGLRRVCSLEFRAGGMVSLSVGAWLPSAAPDDARTGGQGAGNSCLALSAGGGAAELGGSVADRGACNNAVRGLRRVCSLEFRAGGMVSLSVGAGLPSAAPDDARTGGHGAGNSCLALSAGGGAAELGGSVADRGACNNAVRAGALWNSGWRDGVYPWRGAAERRAG